VRLIQREEVLIRDGCRAFHVLQFNTLQIATPFAPPFSPGALHPDPPHFFTSRGEEMASAGKTHALPTTPAQRDLMHQCGGLQRLPGSFAGILQAVRARSSR